MSLVTVDCLESIVKESCGFNETVFFSIIQCVNWHTVFFPSKNLESCHVFHSQMIWFRYRLFQTVKCKVRRLAHYIKDSAISSYNVGAVLKFLSIYLPNLKSVIFFPTERISNASVTSSTNLAIEGNSVNLTCDAAGSVFTRKWMKDGSDLILDDSMMLHDENRVLSFTSLNKNHRGEYSCEIRNPINNEEAKYTLIVYCR